MRFCVSRGISATSSMKSVPPCASSSAPTLRPWAPSLSAPNSSISMRSGVMAAALMTTKGPPARAEAAWMVRAVSSLPAPEAPKIMMRLLVGATRSIVWRNWFMAEERPMRLAACPEICRSSLISRRRREVSMARSAISTSRSALNGFSI